MRILLLCIATAFAVGRAGAAGDADADPGEVPALGGEPDSAEMRTRQVIEDARRIVAVATDDVRAASRAAEAFGSAEVAMRSYIESLGGFFRAGERGRFVARGYDELRELYYQFESECHAARREMPAEDLWQRWSVVVEDQQPAVESQLSAEAIQAAVEKTKREAPELLEHRLAAASAEDKALVAAIMDRVSPQDFYESGAVRLPEMVVYFNKLHIFSCGNVSLDGYHAKGAKEKEKAIVRALSLLPVEYEVECCVSAKKVYVNSLHVCQECEAFVSPVVVQAWKNKCPYCMKEPLL